MSRFLFVVPPLAGHVLPAAAVCQALRARGEQVAWAGPERFLRPLLGPEIAVYPTGLRLYRDLRAADGGAAQAFLTQYVIPLARFVSRAVEEAVESFAPDVVVADQHAIAGALAAYRRGLPWASLMPGSRGLADLAYGSADVDAWIDGHLAGLAPDVPREHLAWLIYSPHLRIAFTTAALTGPLPLDDVTVLVGPALGERAGDPPFDLAALDPARHTVLVTVGTLNVDISADFYQRVIAALAPLGDRLQAIIVAPADAIAKTEAVAERRADALPATAAGAPAEVQPGAGVGLPLPEHIVVVARVPMLHVMPHVDVVVTHGGMNTVGEALAHGKPVVVAPITLDQPTTAAQVVAAGAGVRVNFENASAEELRAAILAVLGEAPYREAARRVGDSFREAGGAAAAAGHLQRLANRG